MISSMTGFGEASAEVDGIAYVVEIKTVNNRYMKANLRLPDIVGFAESLVEKFLRTNIKRGTVNYFLRIKNTGGQPLFDIDASNLQGYVDRLKQISEATGLKFDANLVDMLHLPGTVQPLTPDAELAEKLKLTVLELTEIAVENLKKMRLQEGQCLSDDLLGNCQIIREKMELIGARSPEVLKEYYEKLNKRAQDLLNGSRVQLDLDMVAREVAVFAERSDIAEELTRLDSHLKQFEQCCCKNKDVGRRLDFISQELLREANTIASKASDAEIGRYVIDIKCAVDRIKEQVQNVE